MNVDNAILLVRNALAGNEYDLGKYGKQLKTEVEHHKSKRLYEFHCLDWKNSDWDICLKELLNLKYPVKDDNK